MFNILFVCMGNICRSPSAEGIFIHQLAQSAFKNQVSTDSAGTHGYHVGHPPDRRAIATTARFGISIEQLRSRKVKPSDFDEFDLIIAMDADNLRILKDLRPAQSRSKLALMLEYLPVDSGDASRITDVPDPYYGDIGDFEYMYSLLEPACAGLLKAVGDRIGGQKHPDSQVD
jgi:protein-tyrosine phosphatase